jgi:hypothetical protein
MTEYSFGTLSFRLVANLSLFHTPGYYRVRSNLTRTYQLPEPSLGRDTDILTEAFRGFSQPLQVDVRSGQFSISQAPYPRCRAVQLPTGRPNLRRLPGNGSERLRWRRLLG